MPRPCTHSRVRPAPPGTLSTIVRSCKNAATKAINQNRGTLGQPVWQRNFHQRIVGNEEEVNGIRRYILDNPAQWELDEYNLPGNSGKWRKGRGMPRPYG